MNATAEHARPNPVAALEVPLAHRILWALRREFWESRSLYLGPVVVAGVFLVGFIISMGRWPANGNAHIIPNHTGAALSLPYDLSAGAMMLTIMLVGAFYCLDALHGERRDRSILFWKSLPISDTLTVLVKAAIPILLLPLIGFVVVLGTQLIILGISSIATAATGGSVSAMLDQLSFGRMTLLTLYHLVTAHGIWLAPIYAWLLLVSAWARRAPFVWALLPPLALVFLEKIAFSTTHFLDVVAYRFSGSGTDAITPKGGFPMNPATHITPLHYIATPGLWWGFGFAALCLVVAIRLRKQQGAL
jgi:ABC-2 type transport system permease protein